MESKELRIEIPPHKFGLMNDFDFRRLRLAAADPQVVRWVGPGAQPYAGMVTAPEKVGQLLPVKLLLPLGGLSESPLLDAEQWEGGRYNDFVESLRSLAAWDMCRICALTPAQAQMLADALSRQGLRFRKIPYYSRLISGYGSYEKYWKSRSRSFRSSTSGAFRKIAQGGFEFSDYVGADKWRDLYLRRHSFMPAEDYSIIPGFQTFIAGLIDELQESGKFYQVGLWKEGRLAAALMVIRSRDVFYFYQTAHDPALRSFRPGAVVFCRMLERLFAEQAPLIAFQSDAEYLSHYTDQAYQMVEIEVYSRNLAARALGLYRSFKNSQLRLPQKPAERPEISAQS